MNWPNDADGDVFRRLEENGFNFEKEYEIDFNIDFNSWPLSDEIIASIRSLYPSIEVIEPDEEDLESGENIGYMQFQVVSKLTYDLVMDIQKQVTEKVKKYGGWCESWGVMQD